MQVEVICPNCGYYNNVELDGPYDGEEYEACECNNCGGYFKFTLNIYTEFSAMKVEKDFNESDKPYQIVSKCIFCGKMQVNKIHFPSPGAKYDVECKHCNDSYSFKVREHTEYTTSPIKEPCDDDHIKVDYV